MTSVQAIFSLSECTRHLRDVAQLAKKRFLLTRRVRSCAFRLFGYKDQFWKVVERSGAFASGSFLLYALSGSEYHWTPNDMDLFRAKIPSILNTSCYGPDDIGPFSELDTYLYRRSIRHVMQETYNELMKFKVLSYEMDHVTEWKRLSERAEAHRQHSESISQGTTADAGSHIHYFPEPSFEHKCQCEHILQKHGYCNNRNNQPCDDHLLMTIRRMCPVHRQAANAPIITHSRTSHKAQIMVIIKSYKKRDEKELTIGSHQTKNDTDTFVEVQKEDVKHNIERTFDLDFVKNVFNGTKLEIMRRQSLRDRVSTYTCNDRYVGEINYNRMRKYEERGFRVEPTWCNEHDEDYQDFKKEQDVLSEDGEEKAIDDDYDDYEDDDYDERAIQRGILREEAVSQLAEEEQETERQILDHIVQDMQDLDLNDPDLAEKLEKMQINQNGRRCKTRRGC